MNRHASPQKLSLLNSAKKMVQETWLSPERKSKIFQIPEEGESPVIELECLVTDQTQPTCETMGGTGRSYRSSTVNNPRRGGERFGGNSISRITEILANKNSVDYCKKYDNSKYMRKGGGEGEG